MLTHVGRVRLVTRHGRELLQQRTGKNTNLEQRYRSRTEAKRTRFAAEAARRKCRISNTGTTRAQHRPGGNIEDRHRAWHRTAGPGGQRRYISPPIGRWAKNQSSIRCMNDVAG